MAALGWELLRAGYGLFVLSIVIVSLVFLTDQISDNKALLPNFNNTMYNFLYVGLWIVVAVTSLELLSGIFALGYMVNTMVTVPDDGGEYMVIRKTEKALPLTAPPGRGRRRKLALQAERQRSRSR